MLIFQVNNFILVTTSIGFYVYVFSYGPVLQLCIAPRSETLCLSSRLFKVPPS